MNAVLYQLKRLRRVRGRHVRRVRGTWCPARFTSGDYAVIRWTLVVIAVLRATDYLTLSSTITKTVDGSEELTSLTVLEATVPMSLWSLFLLLGAGTLAVGMWMRRHFLVWAGHSLLGIAYTALVLSVILSTALSQWMSGFRGAGPLALIGIVHWVIWLRTGPVPLHDDPSEPIEEIRGPRP